MPRQPRQHLTQRKDGRYACRYKDRWFMGNTEREALDARDEYKRHELLGDLQPRPKVPTVAEYITTWLPLYKHGVSKKCYNDYARQLEQLSAAAGETALDQVTPDLAAAVWEHYRSMSASTIKRARMLYTALFDSAVDNDYCRKNPYRVKTAKPPAGSSGSHRALVGEELQLVNGSDHRFALAARLMLYAGLRRGEVLALTSSDIDLGAGLIYVTKAVRFDGNAPIIVDPKSEAGRRQIPILRPIRKELTEFVQKAKKAGPKPALVAPSAKGTLMTETAFSCAWASYIHALGVTAGHPVRIRCHDLRHTFCTLILDAGVDIHQAMSWLGHADEKMILKIYDHLTAARASSSVAIVEKSLKNRRKTDKKSLKNQK